MAKPKKFKRLYAPKPKGPKDQKRVAAMMANRQVTVNLTMRHYVNGQSYGPGKTTLTANLAQGLLHTEGHAVDVEEQFRGAKAAIIGPRRGGGHSVKEVPQETFDTEYENAQPSQTISGANVQDNGTGNRF